MYSTKVRTTEEAISATTERLISDIADFACKRDAALSILRQTTIDLDNINSELRDKIYRLNDLTAFIDSQRSTASQIIEDNDKVRKRILDIIGE